MSNVRRRTIFALVLGAIGVVLVRRTARAQPSLRTDPSRPVRGPHGRASTSRRATRSTTPSSSTATPRSRATSTGNVVAFNGDVTVSRNRRRRRRRAERQRHRDGRRPRRRQRRRRSSAPVAPAHRGGEVRHASNFDVQRRQAEAVEPLRRLADRHLLDLPAGARCSRSSMPRAADALARDGHAHGWARPSGSAPSVLRDRRSRRSSVRRSRSSQA